MRTDRAVELGGHLTVVRAPRRPGVTRPPLHPGPHTSRPSPSAPRSAPRPALPPTVRRQHHRGLAVEERYAPLRQGLPRASSAQVARRRRVLALVLVAPVTLAIVVLFGQLAAAVQVAAVPEHTVAVQVQEGESLWQLAHRAAPQADTGAVVERIVEVNGLESAAVSPGQVVQVPMG